MTTMIVPLVGMHFRPPAKVLVEHIHAGAALSLIAEPSNVYDEKAIQVWFWPGDITKGRYMELEIALVGSGWVLSELLSQPDPIMLGFIADSDGKEGSKAGNQGNREVGDLARIVGGLGELKATFSFLPNGKPAVKVETMEDLPDFGDASQ